MRDVEKDGYVDYGESRSDVPFHLVLKMLSDLTSVFGDDDDERYRMMN